MKINDYYKTYLEFHKNKNCRRLHFLGQCFTILFMIFVFFSSNWVLVPLIPFVIYPFAWSGHYFFEKNKPAAFKNPIKAKLCDWIMFKDILFKKISI